MANMVHPLTGSDYIEEQALNAVHSAALASMAASIDATVADALTAADIPGEVATAVTAADIPGEVADAVTAADIPGEVDAAIALLPLAYVTVSATEPTTPASGHIWVDTTAGEVLKVYSGTVWLTVSTS